MSKNAISPTHTTVFVPLLALCLATGCAAGTGSGASSTREPTASQQQAPSKRLTRAELDKLDADLRDRLQAGKQGRFPVRVSFATTPSTDELLELMLTRYDTRYGVGHVDRATLEKIASNDNVRQVTYVTGLAGAGPEPMDGG